MKTNSLLVALMVMMTLLTSCEIIGDIFQAGVWVGVLIVVVVIGGVLWLISKLGRK